MQCSENLFGSFFEGNVHHGFFCDVFTSLVWQKRLTFVNFLRRCLGVFLQLKNKDYKNHASLAYSHISKSAIYAAKVWNLWEKTLVCGFCVVRDLNKLTYTQRMFIQTRVLRPPAESYCITNRWFGCGTDLASWCVSLHNYRHHTALW